MGRPTNVTWIAKKLRDLGMLHRELVAATELGLTGRARLAFEAWWAIATNTRVVRYLGHQLHYDNRLQPVLLPAALGDLRRLHELIGLDDATVLDVGANVGQFAATLKWRFPTATIWSFEPNPHVYPLLERNAAQSDGWTPVPWGLAEKDLELPFWFVEGKSGQGSIYQDNAVVGLLEQQTVELRVKLRELTPERMQTLGVPPTVDLLKVDVEGAEDQVLSGLSQVRWRFLAIELSLDRAGKMSADAAADLISDIWGSRPKLLWQSDPPRGAVARDAIFTFG